MAPTVIRNKGGFTLIEVLVSLLILACGLMASLVGLTSSIKHVFVNEMRNEAIKIAQQQCEVIRNMPYVNVPLITPTVSVTRQIRKQQVPFTVTTAAQDLSGMGGAFGITPGSSAVRVTITVTWTYKDQQYPPYQIQTVKRQMQ